MSEFNHKFTSIQITRKGDDLDHVATVSHFQGKYSAYIHRHEFEEKEELEAILRSMLDAMDKLK